MIVYHGSDSNFKHLRIAKELVRSQATLNNEGMGIYFSTDKSVAASYGKYLYTLDIEDDRICDFTKISVCQSYVDGIIKDVYNQFGVDLTEYIGKDLNFTIDCMYCGARVIYDIGRELVLMLDSCDTWYFEVSEKKQDQIFRFLNSYGKKHLKAYLFNYNIKGIGVLKTTDDDVVKIVNKENAAKCRIE